MNIRLVLSMGVVFFLIGCGGGSLGSGSGGDVGSSGGAGVDTVFPFDAPNLTETTKEAYLTEINNARNHTHDCGHYRKDADGKDAKDADGHYIVDYTGDDTMPAVDPLTWNDFLYISAAEHSADLEAWNHGVTDQGTAYGRVSHEGSATSSDWTAQKHSLGRGSTVSERVSNNAYDYGAGENIAVGTNWPEPKDAIDAWLESPGHCKNLMNPVYTEVGMALVHDDNSYFKYYWTQNLGAGQ